MSTEQENDSGLAAEPLPREYREYFEGQMPPVPLLAGYKIGLFLVAVAMVFLVLVYLGFIVFLGWAMWWWAVHAVDWFFPLINGTHRVFWFLALLYVIPLIVGLMLGLLMLSSFFSRWRIVQYSAPLSHLDHPELFRFLGQLCQQMGAPIPSRIDVTLDINASASFREGFRSLFGNDVMLTIGLPLVAGLNCREFAAILAHELGHFNQRSAMRCSFIIQHVQGWLSRTVYESADLNTWSDEETNAGSLGLLIFVFSKLAIGFVRCIMWVLLVLSHALTSFLSRQMEFHADSCAANVAGADGYMTMMHKLRILTVSFEQAMVKLKNRVARKYPDDFATYIANKAAQSSAQLKDKVAQVTAKTKTRWFESHPADQERNESVLKAAAPGIIHDERPATSLFNNFNGFSRSFTMAAYDLPGRRKIPADQIFTVEAQAELAVPDTSSEETAVKAYFCGLGLVIKPLLLGSEARLGAMLASTRMAQWKTAKAMLEENSLLHFRESLKLLDARMLQAVDATALVNAGIPANESRFPLVAENLEDLPTLIATLEAERSRLEMEIEPFEQAAKKRLLSALNMVGAPTIISHLEQSGALQDEIRDLLHVFGKLSGAFPPLLELRKEFAVLQTLLEARAETGSEYLPAHISDCAATCSGLLARIHGALGSTALPFPIGEDTMSVVDYVRAKRFDADPARMVQLECESHLELLFALYYRLLGRLTNIAMRVEAIVGETSEI